MLINSKTFKRHFTILQQLNTTHIDHQ